MCIELKELTKLFLFDGLQRLRNIVYCFSGSFGEAASRKRTVSFNLIGLDEKAYLKPLGKAFDPHACKKYPRPRNPLSPYEAGKPRP
jgi:hypothetical protein